MSDSRIQALASFAQLLKRLSGSEDPLEDQYGDLFAQLQNVKNHTNFDSAPPFDANVAQYNDDYGEVVRQLAFPPRGQSPNLDALERHGRLIDSKNADRASDDIDISRLLRDALGARRTRGGTGY